MVLAAALFTVMVGLVKIVRVELSPFEVIAWRSVSALPLVALLAMRAGFRLNDHRVFFWRSLTGVVAMTSFYTAALGLPLVDLALVHKLQPVLVAILAPVLLGAAEKPGRNIWWVCGLGLLGCSILLGPTLALGNVYGLWALLATVSSAFAHIFLRSLGQTDRPVTVVFWFQTAVCFYAFGAMWLLDGGVHLPERHLWMPLLAIGLVGTGGQVAMTKAYSMDRASRVAAASYTSPIFAVIGDLLVFSLVPAWNGWLGGLLVVVAGMLLLFGGQEEPGPPGELSE